MQTHLWDKAASPAERKLDFYEGRIELLQLPYVRISSQYSALLYLGQAH